MRNAVMWFMEAKCVADKVKPSGPQFPWSAAVSGIPFHRCPRL